MLIATSSRTVVGDGVDPGDGVTLGFATMVSWTVVGDGDDPFNEARARGAGTVLESILTPRAW